ncbi:Sigma intracellular receptor 2 [Vanrija pseudolonga]|uniref:Efficient mitochondria targeting-associated protein 19 n=1 Tax=Vanrija pseudolonga TaxID=143232 RepID=A0AAF0YB74_9TREE|nr:Sigma intracellular receptor 2 [Vanrija pseudolonga]
MSRFQGRTLDLIWFIFLVPTTLFIDLQVFYPAWLLEATPFPAVLDWYVSRSRDPILLGVVSGRDEWAWLRTFFWLEALFQLPSFIIGAIGLWNTLLVAYGASTATTLAPVLNAVLTHPYSKPPLTVAELGMLLSSYIPFLVFPLGMALDFGLRLVKIAGRSVSHERKSS